MLIESIEIMRGLWEGKLFSHRGEHYIVENARIYTLPEQPIEIMVAASGPESAEAAAHFGDGMIVVSTEAEVIDGFNDSGGKGKPIFGQVTVCWAATEDEGKEIVHRIWPNAGVPGELSQELPLPQHFEQASSIVTPESLAESTPVGPDVARYVEAIAEYADAGVENIYIHQVGPDQQGFFTFWRDELQPALERELSREPVGSNR